MDLESLPYHSTDLLDYLEEIYGRYEPLPHHQDKEVWYRLGQKRVVSDLLKLKERGEQNILENL